MRIAITKGAFNRKMLLLTSLNIEMWCWRRMENNKWSEKVTNEQVLDLIGEKRTHK
jgi:hypothetical protein